jgi:cytochrome c2
VQAQKTTPAALTRFTTDGTGPIVQYGCTTCHTFEAKGKGTRGPNLSHLGDRTTFAADTYDLTLENLTKWIFDAPSMKPMEIGPNPQAPRVGMPSFSKAFAMKESEARNIANNLLCTTSTNPSTQHPDAGC